MKHTQFDVVVIGGGHAGTEAAHASARAGAKTALVTFRRDGIGVMSCNPAVGGLGKGHLVREVDALGGVMGVAADASGIQFRLLNRRKGPAVQGPRTQSDRALYRAAVSNAVESCPRLAVIEGEVVDLKVIANRVSGVVLRDDTVIECTSVVLTTGTFLRGTIHIGDQSSSGGRMGEDPSILLANRLQSLDLPLGRLKTGTPPRLRSSSIVWDGLEMQPADDDPVFFSFHTSKPVVQQISCGITHTNNQTHDIIHNNLNRSAMYGGHIEGVGPRYCPSIEDKVVRFADKSSHQVFLEPEGLNSDVVYPNGISTSLPVDVQAAYVRSMSGLETAEILQPGYAIEYDYVDPRSLDSALQLHKLPGLFLAGQINGTTGYEEAAAQGLVAGLNAARLAMALEPVRFSRSEGYIGVLIDDLVTRGVTEPYRMFTSRAEYRLTLRADNADQRLTPKGYELGLVDDDRWRMFSEKMDLINSARTLLESSRFSPQHIARTGISINQDGKRRSAYDLLSFPDVGVVDIGALVPGLDDFGKDTLKQLKIEATYSRYVDRQKQDADALKADEGRHIPPDFRYDQMTGLSNELTGKLSAARPETLAQVARIDGMTPAALALILVRLRQSERKSA